MTATPAASGSQAPLLIAVAGLGPRAGTTTTAVALARAWPGREAALVVEADPAGGQLAELVGGDPYLGLASLARTIDPNAPVQADRMLEHVQFLPNGVPVLAAPPGPDATRAGLTASLLAGTHASWRALGASVFADCGAPEPDSALAPVLAAADACLVVVRTDHIDPARAAHRILALTEGCRHRGVLLIGDSPHNDFATALALPVLGVLPAARDSAVALVHGTRQPRRGRRLLPAARTITAALREQLRPTRPATTGQQRRTRPPTHHTTTAVARRRSAPLPTVYRLDPATTTPAPAPRPARSQPDTDAAHPQGHTAPARVPGPQDTAPDGSEEQIRPREDDRATDPQAPQHDPAPSSPSREQAEPVLAIRVFGPTRVLWRAPEGGEAVEITGQLRPRSREVLAVLALHPDGLSRTELIDVLWDEHPPAKLTAALANTLSRVRTGITSATGGQVTAPLADDHMRYRLSPQAITVDYWEFTAAVAQRRRASSEQDQAAACERIAGLATTVLATDLTDTWVEPLREAARREALNALGWLAARTADNDPRATLGLLETIIEIDPYNETVWQDILRLHARLGEHAALTRTYSLLTHKLAEIDQTPSPRTRQLLEHLHRTTK
ncbi:BTAD domain-containing putative transcriptional regulator [Nocardia anaemiae]|uniref:BTAD domain-containing putative transcriptional regulator n=1 Tax=Nocardia anaemiae TaxID=263910 RepID=UPI0007A381BF|nr:BTAD domain-containing putative transcriptional regulator [Nocardia anaemiae]